MILIEALPVPPILSNAQTPTAYSSLKNLSLYPYILYDVCIATSHSARICVSNSCYYLAVLSFKTAASHELIKNSLTIGKETGAKGAVREEKTAAEIEAAGTELLRFRRAISVRHQYCDLTWHLNFLIQNRICTKFHGCLQPSSFHHLITINLLFSRCHVAIARHS